MLYGSPNMTNINGNATLFPLFCKPMTDNIIAVQKYGITRRKTHSTVIQLKPSKAQSNNNLPTA